MILKREGPAIRKAKNSDDVTGTRESGGVVSVKKGQTWIYKRMLRDRGKGDQDGGTREDGTNIKKKKYYIDGKQHRCRLNSATQTTRI